MVAELEMDPVMEAVADPDVDWLNSALRGELSAAETYALVLEKYGPDVRGVDVLLQNRISHEARATRLSDEVRMRGGVPAEESGAWGALAKLVEGVAAAIGYEAALATLEEGEDHGQKVYERDLESLSVSGLELVRDYLLPEQIESHGALRALVMRSN